MIRGKRILAEHLHVKLKSQTSTEQIATYLLVVITNNYWSGVFGTHCGVSALQMAGLKTIWSFFLLSLFSQCAPSLQGVSASAVHSGNGGTEFVFAPLTNNNDNAAIGVLLQTVSDKDTEINIYVRGISLDVNITLSPGAGPYNYPLPNSLIYQNVAGKIYSTVVITSDNDIFVLTYNLIQHTSDVFTVIPKRNLGQEYFLATMISSGNGVISISASEQYAYVEIFLTSTVEFEGVQFNAGDIIRYQLLPYETIQLLPQFISITGSRVLSNASLAVRVGCKCTNVPQTVSACDHIAEQLAPFTAWGKVFVITPLAIRTSGYVLQIIAGRDNTTVTYHAYSNVTVKLNMGHYVTVDIQNQAMMTVNADKPISVIQYSTGGSRDDVASGDPSMMRVVPIEQYVTIATFPVYDFSQTITEVRNNYLGITSRCEYMENITVWMDSTPVKPVWMDHYTVELSDGTRYCARWTAVQSGTYSLESQPIMTDGGREIYPRFSAAVYGTDPYESYLYRTASDDRSLTCLDYSSWNNVPEERDCGGDGQFDCDFDSGLCDWTQDVTDSFDWIVRSGSTPSSNTGPSSDHTSGSGQYAYTETSSPRVEGDFARFTSPEVVARGMKCLQFYYHMYGATIGTLNVYVSKVGDPLGIPVFQIVGEQGNSWNLAQVDIMRADTDRFVVTLEGICGSSYTGDIAIDDIIMFSGSCSPERELICDSTSMTLLLDRDLLEISDDAHDVHFKDESCVGYDHDSQHVAITTMYNRCGTKQEQEEDNMVFSNVVTYYKPQPENGTSGIITREHYLHIPVTCYLKRERILGESFTPGVDKYTYDEEGYGEFSLSLDRYTNAGFYKHANDSGMVELGTPLYFGVTLNSVTNLTLLIESCWATSSPYPLDDHRYDIIENGCAVDSTTYIYYTPSPTFERFRVDAFTFIGDYDQVYVHCSILICDYRDTGSRCAQGCLSRARRSLQSTGSRSKPHTITNGPLSDASHFKHTLMVDNDNDGGETYDPLMIAALSALCVLIALTVIMSLVAVRMRRRHGPEMIGYRRVGIAEDY